MLRPTDLLRVRSLKDALNGSIEQVVELGIRLLRRKPFDKGPRKTGHDPVIPA
jgi:hypothetical protein